MHERSHRSGNSTLLSYRLSFTSDWVNKTCHAKPSVWRQILIRLSHDELQTCNSSFLFLLSFITFVFHCKFAPQKLISRHFWCFQSMRWGGYWNEQMLLRGPGEVLPRRLAALDPLSILLSDPREDRNNSRSLSRNRDIQENIQLPASICLRSQRSVAMSRRNRTILMWWDRITSFAQPGVVCTGTSGLVEALEESKYSTHTSHPDPRQGSCSWMLTRSHLEEVWVLLCLIPSSQQGIQQNSSSCSCNNSPDWV